MQSSVRFGDSLPLPPAKTRAPHATRAFPRFFYGLKRHWLHLTHRSGPRPLIPPADQVKKLLVVQLERLGDLVLTEPTLRALRLHYPQAERVLIAPEAAQDLFAGSGWGEIRGPDALGSLVKSKEEFDLVIDLTGRVEFRIAKALKRSGIPIRVGYDRAGRGVFHNVPLPFPEITTPMRAIYLGLAQALGAPATDSVPRLPSGADRVRRGQQLWETKRLREPVILMPGAHSSEQRWSIAGFAATGKSLKQQGRDVAVICGPEEEGLGAALAQAIEVPLVADPTMLELMDLIAASSAVVCNNTGPLHLSCALGTPTVSTMGPTVPWRWWPVSDAPVIVFRSGSQGASADLSLIDPLEVSAAVLHLLDPT